MDMHGEGILEGYTHELLGQLDHTVPEAILYKFQFTTIFPILRLQRKIETKLDESRRRPAGPWLKMFEGFPLARPSCQVD